MKNIIEIIQKYSLTVRCLPYEVVSYWNYKEGDENKKYINSLGETIETKKEIVIQNLDLEYFQKTKPTKYATDTPEKRFENWKKLYPNGKKLLKETKIVNNGGWWYVKETKNTDSIVLFDKKYDKFFAPTLEEAIKLFLDSKNII